MVDCEFSGCDRPQRKGRKLCSAHLEQKRLGKEMAPIRGPRSEQSCSYPGCSNPVFSLQQCSGHYTQARRGQQLRSVRAQMSKGACHLRDVDGNKMCHSCRTWQPLENFSRAVARPDGLDHVCKRCVRYKTIARKYNINAATYLEMLDAQGGRCAVCNETPPEGKALSVDHSHKCCPDPGKSCGKCVRQLLCFKCNAGIGLLRDNPAVLRAAAAYLEGF